MCFDCEKVLAEAARQARLEAKALKDRQNKLGGPVMFEIDFTEESGVKGANEVKSGRRAGGLKNNIDQNLEKKDEKVEHNAVVIAEKNSNMREMQDLQNMLPRQRKGWGPPTSASELKISPGRVVAPRRAVAGNEDVLPARPEPLALKDNDNNKKENFIMNNNNILNNNINNNRNNNNNNNDNNVFGDGVGVWEEPDGAEEPIEGAKNVLQRLEERDNRQRAERAQAKQVRFT